MGNKINKSIKRNRQPFGRKEQRAELLRRNEIFLRQFKQILGIVGKEFFKVKNISEAKLLEESSNNKLLELNYPKVKKKVEPFFYDEEETGEQGFSSTKIAPDKYDQYIESTIDESDPLSFLLDPNLVTTSDPSDKEITIRDRLAVLHGYKNLWETFCDRWHIDVNWDGKLGHLSRFQRPYIQIAYNENNKIFPIIIRISSWTTQKDLRKNWKGVKGIQEKIFHKEKKSSNFSRDLYWYDLYKKGKTTRDILELWADKCPEDIDKLVAQAFIKNFKNKYKTLIGISISNFLEKLKSDDPDMKDIKEDYKSEKELYVTGGTGLGKISSRFQDLIKSTIKNFELKINRVRFQESVENDNTSEFQWKEKEQAYEEEN